MKKLLALTVSLALLIASSNALAITFDLRSGSPPDDLASGPMTVDGLTATLSANTGTLNKTLSGYGINASGGGDDTDAIDGVAGVETVSITFDARVRFLQIGLGIFNDYRDDSAEVRINGFLFPTLTDTSETIDVFEFTSNNILEIGQATDLSWKSGNGFYFEHFIVERTSVPESGTTVAFLGLGVFGLILFRRFRC